MAREHSWTKTKLFGLFRFKAEDVPKIASDFAKKTKRAVGEKITTRIRVEPRKGFFESIADLITGKQKRVLYKNPSQVTDDDLTQHNVSFEGVNEDGQKVGDGGMLSQSSAEFTARAGGNELSVNEGVPQVREDFENEEPFLKEEATLPDKIENVASHHLIYDENQPGHANDDDYDVPHDFSVLTSIPFGEQDDEEPSSGPDENAPAQNAA